MAKYKIGSDDPKITPDAGAGKWNSESWTVKMAAEKAAIIQILPHAYVIIGKDATKHMYHYLGNSGDDYTIDLEGLLSSVQNEKEVFDNELNIARRFVETLPVGTHQITSEKATGAYIYKSEDWNWFYAVGGYSVWGKGTATVSSGANGERVYEMDFEYKFFDRYNWDGGKSVKIFGITVTDKFMATFHRQGLAQEFNMYGSVKRNVKWTGSTSANPTIITPGGRG